MTPKEQVDHMIIFAKETIKKTGIEAIPKQLVFTRIKTMLYLTETYPETYPDCPTKFWEEVKQEIEKL